MAGKTTNEDGAVLPESETSDVKSAERTATEKAAEPEAKAETPASSLPSWLDRHLFVGLLAPMVLAFEEMWRVKQFTVDDSYISFRYARNFAHGLGLVYNEGERVEGYTNFLWTVLLGLGIKVGLDPVVFAKVIGGASLLGAIALLHRIGRQLRPYAVAPCLASWLLATSSPNTGYAVFGLESTLFVFLVLLGVFLFFREEAVYGGTPAPAPGPGSPPKDHLRALPWSGLAFGLAGITRPEAPMYIGILMLFLGRGLFSRRNILRGGLFVAIVGGHLLFRHSYYGAWVPNTLGAKTGNLENQLRAGQDYVQRWMQHTGPLAALIVGGLGYAVWRRQRSLLAIGVLTLGIAGYVVLVGGDWMQNFRFLVPFEPFAFLLVDVAARALFEGVHAAATARAKAKATEDGPPPLAQAVLVLGIGLAVAFGAYRARAVTKMHKHLLATEDRFWRMAAGQTAKLFSEQPRGTIAIGDIGYVGYATDYPILDLLGLVDADIAKMPGGYTQKVGREWLDHFFTKQPRYAIVISSKPDCQHPSVLGSVVMFNDPRFNAKYQRLVAAPLDNGFAWCIYERRGARQPGEQSGGTAVPLEPVLPTPRPPPAPAPIPAPPSATPAASSSPAEPSSEGPRPE